LAGCEKVAVRLDEGALNRCPRLADSLTKSGITHPTEVAGRVAELRSWRVDDHHRDRKRFRRGST
jgi:hypothetical protein